MKIDIIIPTLRTVEEIKPLVQEIHENTVLPHRIIATCQRVSAAANRNFGLTFARSKIIVNTDDDMRGFFKGWLKILIEPLQKDPFVCMVSARLLNPDGTVPRTCANNKDVSQDYVVIPPKRDTVMPSACIAFRNKGLRFDEGFIGSGFEDGDFEFQYLKLDSRNKFVINNKCKLIHLNEMKNQWENNYFEINRAYFHKKWNVK